MLDNSSPTAVASPGEILPPAKPASLAELAKQIREAHAATGQAVGAAVCHALTAGRALIEARPQVPAGQWTRWVKRNCEVSDRHARRYIKLAEAFATSGHSVSGDVLGLSFRAAAKRLTPAAPKANISKRVRAKATGAPTKGLDIVGVWNTTPLPERTRAINNIGLKPLLAALPPEWLTALEAWTAERRKASAPTQPIATHPDGYPELPACLHRKVLN